VRPQFSRGDCLRKQVAQTLEIGGCLCCWTYQEKKKEKTTEKKHQVRTARNATPAAGCLPNDKMGVVKEKKNTASTNGGGERKSAGRSWESVKKK